MCGADAKIPGQAGNEAQLSLTVFPIKVESVARISSPPGISIILRQLDSSHFLYFSLVLNIRNL